MNWIACLGAAALAAVAGAAAPRLDALARGFARPPASARPWVYWWWLDSMATREGITRDLEEMKQQGIAGALVFDAGEGHGTPVGPRFMSPPWRELFQYATREAARLGLELSFNQCSGWDCGGTWVTPAHALKRLVWSEVRTEGPVRFSQPLPPPAATNGYYQEIAVLAFRVTGGVPPASPPPSGTKPGDSTAADYLDRGSVIDLTDKLTPAGQPVWQTPAGKWIVMRFGQTLSGGGEGSTKCTSPGARGYEIDFLSQEALDAHFAETTAKVASDGGPLTGKTLKYVHEDSWESGEPNWTPRMAEEFQRRLGYDPLPYLPVLAGKTMDDQETSMRFQRDFRRTIADLMAENHYGRLRELARRWGMSVHAEAGGPFFVSMMDALMNLGRTDIPMGEYWIRQKEPAGEIWYTNQYAICDAVKQAASAAHTYGKKLCQAEAFTNMGRNWEEAPSMLKDLADRAFCAGLTRNMLCFYVHQPDLEMKPGYQWPEAGTHLDRNITWWNQMHAFVDYLSRCQFLLQEGVFVADVCYFAGEDAPCYVPAKHLMQPPLPAGYDCDTINGEVLLTRLSVRGGRLVLPDGMNYRLLVLPQRQTMTPEVLERIAGFLAAGATVVGPKPLRSPSLQNFPQCDWRVQTLADKVWGGCDGQTVREHAYGKGRVFWGIPLTEVLRAQGIQPDFEAECAEPDASLDYIHRRSGQTEIFFVANQRDRPQEARCTFRVRARQPELWDPLTGVTRTASAFAQTDDGRTQVPLELPPRGSVFVLFRQPIGLTQKGTGGRNDPSVSVVQRIEGPWTVRFDTKWGGPRSAEFATLACWTARPEEGIRHYSGTATYQNTFELTDASSRSGNRLWLDLGEVRELAQVRLNGNELGVVWTKPFRVEITKAAQAGVNRLEVDVINLWPNRLIGDQSLPEAKRFTKTNVKKFRKDSPLLRSGLLGPVTILAGQWE
jgi:hypothetical protein